VVHPPSNSRATFVVVVLVSAVLLSGCDWVMYRSNAAHTGESPGEKVIGVGNVGTLGEAWTTNHDTAVDNVVGSNAFGLHSAAIADRHVRAGCRDADRHERRR